MMTRRKRKNCLLPCIAFVKKSAMLFAVCTYGTDRDLELFDHVADEEVPALHVLHAVVLLRVVGDVARGLRPRLAHEGRQPPGTDDDGYTFYIVNFLRSTCGRPTLHFLLNRTAELTTVTKLRAQLTTSRLWALRHMF